MQFVETRDYILVRHTQDTILASYLNDMSKYNNLNEIKKTRLAYDNITVQLSKKNTRFQYKLIKKGGRASEFEKAIEWLCLSGIVSQVYKVEQVKKPLENYRDIDAFKIYVSDLGLLCAKKDLAANDVLYMVDELDDFKGGMAENYVNMQLSINGYRTYYWESERGAEIDFVIQRDGQLIPVEVKSADNTKAKSLKVYMDTYKPAYAIKLSAKNFGCDGNKKIVLLFMPHSASEKHIVKRSWMPAPFPVSAAISYPLLRDILAEMWYVACGMLYPTEEQLFVSCFL